jgi:hypothetical protein
MHHQHLRHDHAHRPADTSGSKPVRPLRSLVGTFGLAAALGGSLLLSHAGAATSRPSEITPVSVGNAQLSAYSTQLSHHLRAEHRKVHRTVVRRRDRRAAERRAERRAEQRRQRRLAAAQPSGTPREMARTLVLQRGWDDAQFTCLDQLWSRESGWNPDATNAASDAYGIPQALPGSRMAAAGSDWQTNPLTQIRWGLDYIAASYGTPCGALEHSDATGYY